MNQSEIPQLSFKAINKLIHSKVIRVILRLDAFFLILVYFFGAANFTSNNPTIIAGDSIKAKPPTIKPSKAIF